ncbi:MAG: erythromycin esterase family protein [Deltaproteobacteria bacterium]|nr:erythromycin esterase family protein [Deltaproteobacteria bacterium]
MSEIGHRKDHELSMSARDKGMADVFFAQLERRRPGAKAIIYAHNNHIARAMEDRLPFKSPKFARERMGSFLAERFGSKYVSIGFLGYDIKLNHHLFKSFIEPPIPISKSSIERRLHDTGAKEVFVDLSKGFLQDERWYDIQDNGIRATAAPGRHYTGLYFVDFSPPLTERVILPR